MWTHLLIGLLGGTALGGAIGSFVTHAIHLSNAQVQATAKVLHLSPDRIRAVDDAAEAGAQAGLALLEQRASDPSAGK